MPSVPHHQPAAFSLVELVIVVVIMGIIAAIAIPRMSSAASNARAGALRGDISQIQRSIEFYAAEHADRGPEIEPDGSLTALPKSIPIRLMRPTTESGAISASGIYGPYLRLWPRNPYNGHFSIRIDGPPAGAGLTGWRLTSATRLVEADHVAGTVTGAARGAVDVGTVEASP